MESAPTNPPRNDRELVQNEQPVQGISTSDQIAAENRRYDLEAAERFRIAARKLALIGFAQMEQNEKR